MLLHLQKQEAFADLRYDIRLFVPDPESPGVGESLNALLSPGGTVFAREADAFAVPSDSHLRPKLRVAVRGTSDFRRDPEGHPAHLSLLFDVFPAEDVGASRATPREASAPVHGLVQDFQVEYQEDENAVAWRRQPRHGLATPIEQAEALTDLLADLSSALSSATATVATGQTALDLRPVVTLALDADDRALLHQVHEVSDWVLTLDRNMGIEFFDHGGKPGRPDYLIDHSPESLGNARSSARHHFSVGRRTRGNASARPQGVPAAGRGATRRGPPRSAAFALGAPSSEAHFVPESARRGVRARSLTDVPRASGRLREPDRPSARRSPGTVPRSAEARRGDRRRS